MLKRQGARVRAGARRGRHAEVGSDEGGNSIHYSELHRASPSASFRALSAQISLRAGSHGAPGRYISAWRSQKDRPEWWAQECVDLVVDRCWEVRFNRSMFLRFRYNHESELVRSLATGSLQETTYLLCS